LWAGLDSWIFPQQMKIRRLEIAGFKSFADRVVFSFDDGITGVVGPNGCGKSNVVDAIRWAMGEQSAKHLRGRSMEDVIFSGSESRPPTGMAEVSLTFQNDGRLVPPQYAAFGEITVTRRLFRNGESDYEINKAACRLLDITELFLGTGIGTRAYSIIEQGRIGLIVSARPEDRRGILEEAAGVTKYKARRKQAERRLEATEQNLLRLSDVVGEVQKRLASLERAARKAERFRELRSELKGLELLATARRWLAAEEEARAAAADLGAAEENENIAEATVARLEAGLSAERVQLALDDRKVQDLAERSHAVDRDLRLSEQQIEFARREREALSHRKAQHEEEVGLLGIRLELLSREEEGHHEEVRKLADAGAEDEARRELFERDLETATSRIHSAQRAVEEERHAAVSVLTRLANHRTNLVNLERRRQDLAARHEKLAGEAAQLESRGIEISQKRAELVDQLARSQATRNELRERRSAQEDELQRGTDQRRETEALLIRIREELADRRSRLTSLLELQKNFEGYGHGVKAILLRDEDERRRDGVYGLVAEVLRTDPAHERAIEAVLGERLQLVLVESHAAGSRAVEYLRKASQGRASFAPLTEMEQLPLVADTAELGAPEGTVRAVDVVECATEHDRLKRFLLADVFLCDTLASALALWARDPGRRTFVSIDGEVVDREGIVSGGSLAGVADGLLHKRRELQDLAGTVQDLEARVALSTAEAHQLSERQTALDTAVRRLLQEEREEELSEIRLERDVARLQEDLVRVSQRTEVLSHERAQLDAAQAEVEREEGFERAAVVAFESEQKDREAKLRALQAELVAAREKSDAVQAEVTRAKVNAAAVAERREGVARALARLAEQRTEVEERLAKLRAELSAADERAAALDAKVEVSRSELAQLLTSGEALRAELGRARALQDEAGERLRGGDEEVRAARAELETVSHKRAAIELRLQEVRLTSTHLEEGVRERHLVELSELAQARRDESLSLDVESAEARMQELRQSIEALGEVSLTAIDEAREVGERHAFLSAQKQDLEDSIARLRAAISRIERASKERFRETFALVNEKFQHVFPRLFRGGRAELQLVADALDPDGEAGVEIVAQPPGKKLSSVNLLSGGEKALTAVSLIFAIFLVKPTPFCLLDEVDAPLDDANVGRYNEMVREMSRSSQFIVITHNKRTMEIADALYGVTMEEAGISKTVSVKLSQKAGDTAAA
jgi:chromosome segregation protein